MNGLLRVLLIAVLVYLVVRSLLAIVLPRRRNQVKGESRGGGRIDEERIQDAEFKDISDK